MNLLRLLDDEDLDPNRTIIVHCDAEEDMKYHVEAAQRGAWIEYDALSEQNAVRTLKLIDMMVNSGFEDQLLLSQDAGWYHVGEVNGGDIRSYVYLVRDFVRLLAEEGFSRGMTDKLLVSNPARAFKMDST